MTVSFYGNVCDYTDCKSLELDACSDLQTLIKTLTVRFGEHFEKFLLDENGNIGDNAFVLINGKHIMNLGGLMAPLQADDKISILPVVEAG